VNPAWITALLALVTAVATVLTIMVRIVWKLGVRVVHFLDDYAGTPERLGEPARPGFMVRLGKLEGMVTMLLAETRPNGGTSLRDVVHKTADDVAEVRHQVENINGQITDLGQRVTHVEHHLD